VLRSASYARMFWTAVDEAPEQRDELGLLVGERARLGAENGEHPDRACTEEQRCGELAAEAQVGQRALLAVALLEEVLAHHELPAEHFLEHRAGDGRARSGWIDRLLAAAGRGHHLRAPVLREDDRGALERDEPAQLADERAERLLDLERRAEGPRAAVRRLEHVDAPAELVAQPLRLHSPARPPDDLRPQVVGKPAHEHSDEKPDAAAEGEHLRREVRIGRADLPELGQPEHAERCDAHADAAQHAEAQCRLENRDEDERPEGLRGLEVEDQLE
jgi:hypothetical protein